MPDPFPQRSSAGCVWYRYNVQESRGEICIPTIRDHAPQVGGGNLEIYRCQLCSKLMHHATPHYGGGGKAGMKQIFQDLVGEINRLYYQRSSG